MKAEELLNLIAAGETLTVEFKSDRVPLPDADLIETVVCLANEPGGGVRTIALSKRRKMGNKRGISP